METPNKEILQHLDFNDRFLSVARSQVGLAEIPKGSNWGKNVQKYLASVGINFPASWCMAYVYWCVNEACKEMQMPNPLVKTGGVLKQWHDITPALKSDTPKRGSIFIMDFGKGLGHTGIVESVNRVGTINTIEGNSNDEGSREGYEVCRRIRNVKSCVGFINIS
jgi:hypothetical protein